MTPCRRSEAVHDASTISEIDRAAEYWSDNVQYWSQWSASTEYWSASSGYLSSFLAMETGVGLQSCPWLVDVPPGRQVNVTLLRFSEPWTGGRLTAGCEWTIVVREGNVTTHLPACAGGSGGELARDGGRLQRILYTSHRRGTPLTVYLRPTATSVSLRSQLLIHFQG